MRLGRGVHCILDEAHVFNSSFILSMKVVTYFHVYAGLLCWGFFFFLLLEYQIDMSPNKHNLWKHEKSVSALNLWLNLCKNPLKRGRCSQLWLIDRPWPVVEERSDPLSANLRQEENISYNQTELVIFCRTSTLRPGWRLARFRSCEPQIQYA